MTRIQSICLSISVGLIGMASVESTKAQERLSKAFGKKSHVTAIKYSGKQHQLEIVGTYDMLGKNHKSKFSLKNLLKVDGILATLNAGSSASKSYPIPMGGLLSRGKLLSDIDEKNEINTWLLCTRDKKAVIIPRNKFSAKNYRSCVQSGPILIQDSKEKITKIESQERRSAICLSKNQDLLLVHSDPISFLKLAKILLQEPFRCESALAMSSAYQSGMIFRNAGKIDEIGETENTIPSALLIYKSM